MSTLTITRIAHSSVLIDIDGHAVLTDPWYSERPGYYHGEPYGITLSDLPRLDGIAVSHDHYDHYDMESFAAYPYKDVPFAVKRGTARKARQLGARAINKGCCSCSQPSRIGKQQLKISLPKETRWWSE